MTDLKSCPFCGGKAEAVCYITPNHFLIKCTKCKVEQGRLDTHSNAVRAWNRRVK